MGFNFQYHTSECKCLCLPIIGMVKESENQLRDQIIKWSNGCIQTVILIISVSKQQQKDLKCNSGLLDLSVVPVQCTI